MTRAAGVLAVLVGLGFGIPGVGFALPFGFVLGAARVALTVAVLLRGS